MKTTNAHVVVLGTGGTIAGRAADAADALGYVAGQIGVRELVGQVSVPGVALRAEQVANVDSKDMEFAIWRELAGRCSHWVAQDEVSGVVVTHGTDTLEETAFFLHSVLPLQKPVVLTCAMRPATAFAPDGPQNLRDAIVVAAAPGARGVLGVCAGAVHSGEDVRKVHTYRVNAFSSGDNGALGDVEEGRLRQLRAWPDPPAAAATSLRAVLAADALPRGEILTSHAGARGAMIDMLVRERAAGSEGAVQGLVLAGTGNGTLHHSVGEAALRALEAGIAVWRTTRCANGRVLPHAGDALPGAGPLTSVQARVAMMLALLRGEDARVPRLT